MTDEEITAMYTTLRKDIIELAEDNQVVKYLLQRVLKDLKVFQTVENMEKIIKRKDYRAEYEVNKRNKGFEEEEDGE